MTFFASLFGGSAACKEDAAWAASVSPATFVSPAQVEAAQAAVGKLPKQQEKAVEAVLLEIYAVPATLDGLRAADAALVAGLQAVSDPDSDIDGIQPAAAALQGAAAVVLQGKVAETAAGIDTPESATTLVRFTREAAGLDPAQRALLREEAAAALKGDLYVQALKALATPQP